MEEEKEWRVNMKRGHIRIGKERKDNDKGRIMVKVK